jgi:hypothetical protein
MRIEGLSLQTDIIPSQTNEANNLSTLGEGAISFSPDFNRVRKLIVWRLERMQVPLITRLKPGETDRGTG